MTVLPDTSVWIDYYRDRDAQLADSLDRLLRDDAVVLCGPVLAELLAGTPSDERVRLQGALLGVRWLDVDRPAWERAGELSYELRRRGQSVPLVDLVLATAGMRAGAALWTRDRDFERIREIFPQLELYEPVG